MNSMNRMKQYAERLSKLYSDMEAFAIAEGDSFTDYETHAFEDALDLVEQTAKAYEIKILEMEGK